MPNNMTSMGTYFSGNKRNCWNCRKEIQIDEIIFVTNNKTYCKKCGKDILQHIIQPIIKDMKKDLED